VCILSMCIAGSWAAYLVDNFVLGSFTLFLTFFIGIRFLVSPDTSRKNQAEKGEKLDLKGIAISLFFGLTIGFGTGFVGTGGGMMMLVVFTVFLGMCLKTAVGTSTFIMTFTALIASVSHILIHPAIVLEKWDVMAVSIALAAAASLVSARFANRVKARTAGLVTGGVLTVLGASMLLLDYHDLLSRLPYYSQILHCIKVLVLYILPSLMVLLPVRFLTRLPSYIFRKLLHIVAFVCVSLMILSAGSWQAAALTSLILAVVIYPLLALFEKEPWYPRLFVEKRKGEIKCSMLMLFLMFAALTALCWGLFDQRVLCAASILMWGTGDAAAALTGIPFGKHKARLPFTDGKKSWEGSGAMFLVSLLAGSVILLFLQELTPGRGIMTAGAGALTGAAVELFSPSEFDTVTVPAAIALVLLLFS
ncbi:MAG: TSUP family transporter, partial [Lachnospiraceae bacterium]|nr:TSUP family transporter [Lachnospiraceae bacterium]